MGRIATAQGGNNPTTHKCGKCGEFGHNRRTCPDLCLPATRPLPRKGSKKCSVCGKLGHNKRTCPTLLEQKFEAEVAKVEQKFELELSALLNDEAPMESDVELTPTPRDEVDVATEGYTGILLDNDVLGLIGEQVLAIRDKETRDYWETTNQQGKFIQFDNLNLTEFILARNKLFSPTHHTINEAPWETIEDCRQDRRIDWVGEITAPESGNTWVKYVADEIGETCKQVGFGKGRNWNWKKTKCGKCGVYGHTSRSTRFHPTAKTLSKWYGKNSHSQIAKQTHAAGQLSATVRVAVADDYH